MVLPTASWNVARPTTPSTKVSSGRRLKRVYTFTTSRGSEEDCTIIACKLKAPLPLRTVRSRTDHPNHIGFQLNDKLAPGSYSYLIVIDGVGLICTCLWRKQQ